MAVYTLLNSDDNLPLIDGQTNKKKHGKNRITRFFARHKRKIRRLLIFLFLSAFLIFLYIYSTYYYCSEPTINDKEYSKIKGESYYDKYGIDLNQYLTKEMYNQKIPGNDTLDSWDLYTPVCPHLEPVHYPEEILNPNCEDIGLQFVDFKNNLGRGKPHILHLHSITTQIKNWNEWSKRDDKIVPNYYYKNVENLVDDTYHPFDYGYYDENETILKNEEDTISFYKNVINSRMDEVPDPRHRRIFSFILFNTEFDLLDLYLTEYYEIFDYFVIYESNATFSGKPKPLYFTRTLLETDRYEKFKDKIIAFPLPVDRVCKFYREPFSKEHIARRQLIEMGLRAVQARHGDIYLHGDLDEFVKPHILTRIKKCGGWEHLQAGIGGGPQSSRLKKVDSYLQDKKLNRKLERDKYGFPKLVYDRELSIGFLNWFYEYSFEIVENSSIGTTAKPNIAIFDARRALGQYPIRYNYTESEGDGNFMVDDKYTKFNRRSLENIPKEEEEEEEKEEKKKEKEKEELIIEKLSASNNLNENENKNENENNENENKNENVKENKKVKRKVIPQEDENDDIYVDPLTQPDFDPYKGYSYTNNRNDNRDGEGYLGEFMRFTTCYSVYGFSFTNATVFWSGGWHMSSFLPTVDHFINKLLSYSHFVEYTFMPKEKRKQTIIDHINNKSYIYNKKTSLFSETEVKYDDSIIEFPNDPEKGYQYDFNYNNWKSFSPYINSNYHETAKLFYHEIPDAVWKNPICYSYMLDRQFGLTKKLWWQQIPKEEWSSVEFEKLDKETLEKITPSNIPDNLKPKALRKNEE